MRCPEIKSKLSDYLDHEVERLARTKMDEHFASCTDCRRELESLRMIRTELQSLPRVPAPAGFLDAVHQRIARDSWRRRIFQRLFQPLHWKLPLELAGVLASALLIVFSYHALQDRPNQTPLRVAEKSATPLPRPGTPAPTAPATAPESLSSVREELQEIPLGAKTIPTMTLVLRVKETRMETRAYDAESEKTGPLVAGYTARDAKTEAKRTVPPERDQAMGQPEPSTASETQGPPDTLTQLQEIIRRNQGRIRSINTNKAERPGLLVDCTIPRSNLARFRADLGEMGAIEGPTDLAQAQDASAILSIRIRILSAS